AKEVIAAFFDDEERHVLSVSYDKLTLWDIKNGNMVKSFSCLEGGGYKSMVFKSNGRYILSAEHDNSIKVCNFSEGHEDKKYKGFTVPSKGHEIKRLKGHFTPITAMALSRDGKYALSGSEDRTIMLWDIPAGQCITSTMNLNPVTALAFSSDFRYVLVGDKNGGLNLLEVPSLKRIRKFIYEQLSYVTEIRDVAFSPGGKYALSASQGLILWDVDTGKEVRMFEGYNNIIYSAAFSPDGRYVLSGGGDLVLKLWNVSSGELLRVFKGHKSPVTFVGFGSDGRRILSGSTDKTTKLWDTESGQEICQMIKFGSDDWKNPKNDWICITPEGYFNASKDGARYLNVRIGNDVCSIDQFFERFYNPAAVAQILSRQRTELADNIQKGFKTPPEVTILSPKSNEIFNSEEIELTVQAKDTGGGVSEVRLYHNGSVIGEEKRGIKIVEATP
ncbi:MAG: Ig-like domain-containing protein, partial [Planctomycetota bacterium]